MAGNQGNNRIVWQQWQLQFLKENWQCMNARQLSEALGLSCTIVRMKKYELGYLSMQLEYWTDEQIAFLKKYYQKTGDTELAQMFNERWHKNKGWTKKHIEKKRRYLGLKRTAAEKSAIQKRNTKNGMFAMCPVKSWITRGGAAPEGETRMWKLADSPVQVIKVNGRWVHHARHLYIKTFGNIPRNCLVRLKDNNPYNVIAENLMLVNRSEHAILNSQSRNNLEIKRLKTKAKIRYQIDLITKKNNEYEKQIERLK